MNGFMKVFVLLISPALAAAQSPKEMNFQNTAKAVVQKLATRDSAGLSKFIDTTVGVYILYRIGVQDQYKQYKRVNFKDSAYPNAPFYDEVKLTKLEYSPLPAFDCAKSKWNKYGSFVDTTKTDQLLSKTARRLVLYKKKKITPKAIQSLIELESRSRRIIVANKSGKDLVFYLTLINNKWYLTMIDKITTDCSV